MTSANPTLHSLTPAEAGARAAANDDNQTIPIDAWTDKVIFGECQQVLRRMPDASVDFVLTDPPYLVRYKDRAGRSVANDDNACWMFQAFSELYRVLKPNSYCVSFYGWSKADRFLSVWKECGFQPVSHLIWLKAYGSAVGHTRGLHECAYLLAKGYPTRPALPPGDVLPWKYTGNVLHPTQKPVSGLTPLIEAFSPLNGIVLDPFAGSGTTGVAAQRCKRRFILIEKELVHYRTACERLR